MRKRYHREIGFPDIKIPEGHFLVRYSRKADEQRSRWELPNLTHITISSSKVVEISTLNDQLHILVVKFRGNYYVGEVQGNKFHCMSIFNRPGTKVIEYSRP